MSQTKQEALDEAIKVMREVFPRQLLDQLDMKKVGQYAFIINCGYKPDLALTPFTSERIFWLMDERSQWLTAPAVPMEEDNGTRFNIWRFNSGKGFGTQDEEAYSHPAIFPDRLPMDHILSWSNENDVVLDPFSGSGTTCKGALKLKRNYLGIEINPDYVKISEERIARELAQLKLPI